MGFMAEKELGVKLNIANHFYIEGVGSLQFFPFGTFPSLKIGLGIDL